MGHRGCDAAYPRVVRKTEYAPLPPCTLRPSAWQSVCAQAQVFRKKLHQLVGKSSTKRAPASALSELLMMPHSQQVLTNRLALRELERLARLGAAVLLALDHPRVAGEKAALLQDAAQIRFEIGQRLRDAVTHRARLARQTATGHGADHVVLACAGRRDQRLLNHHPQHRTGEIDFDFAGVDDDLAGAGLDPDARNRVLALSGGVGTALLVDLLDVFRRFRRGRLEQRQLIERLHGVGHFMQPSCSCDSSKRYRPSRVAEPRADARGRGKRVSYRAERGPTDRVESCARWPSRPRARENGPRGSTLPCVP